MTRSTNTPTPRDAFVTALASELVSVYDCTRVWEAWSVGTMSQNDFSPVEDRVDEIADTALGALIPALRETIAAEVNIGDRYATADRILAAIAKATGAQ